MPALQIYSGKRGARQKRGRFDWIQHRQEVVINPYYDISRNVVKQWQKWRGFNAHTADNIFYDIESSLRINPYAVECKDHLVPADIGGVRKGG